MEIIDVFFVGQVSGLVENFDIGIFSDTIDVINIKLCMLVLIIELYPTFDIISRSQPCQYLKLNRKFYVLNRLS